MRTHCVLRNIYLGTILDIFRTYYVEFVHKYDTSTDLASLMEDGLGGVHCSTMTCGPTTLGSAACLTMKCRSKLARPRRRQDMCLE